MHRSSHSAANLQPPLPTAPERPSRRMTSPSLNPPENPRPHTQGRPPSPLRNGFIPNSSTGIDPDAIDDDDDDDDEDDEDMDDEDRERARLWAAQRSPSPALSTSSVSQMATSLAQRVGTFVSGAMAPLSPGPESMSMSTGHLTDAELEAEAERERDRGRREAERILTMEARERKVVEERVLAMMESARALPPPPSRSQSVPVPPVGSPSGSQRESWWTAAKNKLTPTKEKDLTPAQQVIQDVKKQDKERDKETRKSGKGKEKSNEWPANPNSKYSDPSMLNLNVNTGVPTTPPRRHYVSSNSPGGSPNSPTPSRTPPRPTNLSAPNLSPAYSNTRGSPAGAGASPKLSLTGGASSASPSKEAPPLYATFSPAGVLDVPVTLLTIAKRFEKLEKWTVGHVRALEERMSDVERWLVDKEKEREEEVKEKREGRASLLSDDTGRRAEEDGHSEEEGRRRGRALDDRGKDSADASQEIQSLRDEVMELQGRITELGREMARMAVEPGRLVQTNKGRGTSDDSYNSYNSYNNGSYNGRGSYELMNGRREESQSAEIEGLDDDEPAPQAQPSQDKTETKPEDTPTSPSSSAYPGILSVSASQPSYPSTMRPQGGLSRIPSLGAGTSTSPPMARTLSRQSTGTGRGLPYPTGDYTVDDANGVSGSVLSGTNSGIMGLNSIMASGSFSPTHSPPSSVSKTNKGRPLSTSYSLASMGTVSSMGTVPGASGASPNGSSTTNPNNESPSTAAKSSRNLPIPPSASNNSNSGTRSRQQSTSPSPASGTKERKRYTVALGGPLVPPNDWDEQQRVKRDREIREKDSDGSIGRAFFTASPSSTGGKSLNGHGDEDNDDQGNDDDDEEDEFADETIGKSASARIVGGKRLSRSNAIKDRTPSADSLGSGGGSKSLTSSPSNRERVRPHSAYGGYASGGIGSSLTSSATFPVGDYQGFSGHGPRHMQKSQSISITSTNSVAPLKPRLRTRSTDRSMLEDVSNGGGGGGGGPAGSRFVDPLILRRQEQEATKPKLAMPKPVGKVPIGQLVAFFDGERR
ncbi:hypothetical protein K435DRAFT_63033 [Dendrothele bispora CBS 962.96]|uniref:Uncharacterized protein n=1 Tax=Dendrothele bispora (strain CBS 962.96) TaxID=1314807 RepID=A0A4S8M5J4_DENBC|nr:hypothetical protein K435DRAFT_63033 [Dendrothele bispora CBS 962.96]